MGWPKNIFFLISIFRTNLRPHSQAVLHNPFTLRFLLGVGGLCYFSVTFVNRIYFPVRIHSGSLYLDAELISHTQTPAHGHPADHSQAANDDQRPGLQEGCKYSPKQLNHLLQARGSLPDLAHWFIVTRRNPARRQGSGRMQGRTFSGQPRMPTLAGKRLPSLLVCPQSLGVL